MKLTVKSKKNKALFTIALSTVIIVSSSFTTISCANLLSEPTSIKAELDQEYERIKNLRISVDIDQTKKELNLQQLWDLQQNPELIWNYLNQDFRLKTTSLEYQIYKIEFTFVNEMRAYLKIGDPATGKNKIIVFDLNFKIIHKWK